MFLFIDFLIFCWFAKILNQIGYIDWHLINVCIVEGFNVFQRTLIIFSNKIDSNTFTAETSTATNSVERKNSVSKFSLRDQNVDV